MTREHRGRHQKRRRSLEVVSSGQMQDINSNGNTARFRETESVSHPNLDFHRTGSLECAVPNNNHKRQLNSKVSRTSTCSSRLSSPQTQPRGTKSDHSISISRGSSRPDVVRVSPGRIIFMTALCCVVLVLSAVQKVSVRSVPTTSQSRLPSTSTRTRTRQEKSVVDDTSRKLSTHHKNTSSVSASTLPSPTIQLQLKEHTQQQQLKVPYPIIVLNLPKSGTTALWQYFECGLGPDQAVHWWTPNTHDKHHKTGDRLIGPCLHANIRDGTPPLQGCGENYKVWLDAGYANQTHCFQPAVHGLEAIYQHYPHATLLWVSRDTASWYQSVQRWRPLMRKWSSSQNNCRQSFFPNTDGTEAVGMLEQKDFVAFYERTRQHARDFARTHPSLTYLEPPSGTVLSSPSLGPWLEENVGIDHAKCWRKCRPNGQHATCEDEQQGGKHLATSK